MSPACAVGRRYGSGADTTTCSGVVLVALSIVKASPHPAGYWQENHDEIYIITNCLLTG